MSDYELDEGGLYGIQKIHGLYDSAGFIDRPS